MHAIVAAGVSTSDSIAFSDEHGAASAATAFSDDKNCEDTDGIAQLRLLPHLLVLSNVALSLRLNSEANSAFMEIPETSICFFTFLPSAGSVFLSSQALAICLMQKDHEVSQSE